VLRRPTVLLVLVLALLAAACGDDGGDTPVSSEDPSPASTAGADDPVVQAVPARPPAVTGTLRAPGRGAFSIAIDEGVDDYYKDLSLQGVDQALIVRQTADGDVAATVDDLADGTRVAVWLRGGCRESFPVQCDAEAVRIRAS
jgi:hypothetical protein